MPELTLRTARREDAPALAAIYAPYVLESTASFESVPPNANEMAARIVGDGAFPFLVCEGANGAPLGYAYGRRMGERAGYDWAAQLSVYVDESRTHGGAGRALYTALLKLLAAQGYRTAWGIVSCPNPASERFHETMGFVRQGCLESIGYKFGRPLNVVYYGKALAPVMENPPRPRFFCELSEGDVAACLTVPQPASGASPK